MEQTRSLLKSLAVKESGAIGVRRYSERRLTKKAKCGGCPPHKNISVFGFANTAHILEDAKSNQSTLLRCVGLSTDRAACQTADSLNFAIPLKAPAFPIRKPNLKEALRRQGLCRLFHRGFLIY